MNRRIFALTFLLIIAGTAVLSAFLFMTSATAATSAVYTTSVPLASDQGAVAPSLDNSGIPNPPPFCDNGSMMLGGSMGFGGQGGFGGPEGPGGPGGPGGRGGMMAGGPMRGQGGPGLMLNSTEFAAFEQNATDIAKSDSDVQTLLAQNYNITGVRPVMSNTTFPVWGSNETAARPLTPTSAIVMLQKDSSSNASVFVDLLQGKVTKIEIWTKTVIEKP